MYVAGGLEESDIHRYRSLPKEPEIVKQISWYLSKMGLYWNSQESKAYTPLSHTPNWMIYNKKADGFFQFFCFKLKVNIKFICDYLIQVQATIWGIAIRGGEWGVLSLYVNEVSLLLERYYVRYESHKQ